MRAVNTFLEYLLDYRRIDFNPMAGVRIRRCRSHPLPRVLDEQQVIVLLEAPDTRDPLGIRDRAMLEVTYSCGIRRTELTGLETPDVLRGGAALLVRRTKGGRERIVPPLKARAPAAGPPRPRWCIPRPGAVAAGA